MLLELFDSFRAWQGRLSVSRVRLVTVLFFLAGAALAASGAVMWSIVPAAAVTAGGLAGAAWVAVLQIVWWRLVPVATQERLDARALLSLQHRRLVGAVFAVLWLLLMAVVSRSSEALGGFVVLVGAVNVVVLVNIAHLVVASPQEREEWSQEQEALARQRAYARAVKKGLVPPPGSEPPVSEPEEDGGAEVESDDQWDIGEEPVEPVEPVEEQVQPTRERGSKRRWLPGNRG